MRRERVSDDIYVFTSDLYAQVTASAIVTREGIVVIDTLPFPVETREMIEYLRALGQGPVKYLVNTHWHGDHTGGNENLANTGAVIVAHDNVRVRMSSEQFIAALNSRTPASPPPSPTWVSRAVRRASPRN